MMLETRADFFRLERIDIVEIEHAVRIAHGDTGHLVSLAIDFERMIHDLAVRGRTRNRKVDSELRGRWLLRVTGKLAMLQFGDDIWRRRCPALKFSQ